jgi:hypothetical protein
MVPFRPQPCAASRSASRPERHAGLAWVRPPYLDDIEDAECVDAFLQLALARSVRSVVCLGASSIDVALSDMIPAHIRRATRSSLSAVGDTAIAFAFKVGVAMRAGMVDEIALVGFTRAPRASTPSPSSGKVARCGDTP